MNEQENNNQDENIQAEARNVTLKSVDTTVRAKVGVKQALNLDYDGAGPLSYVSSNTAACAVNAAGQITPYKGGNAMITVTAPDAAEIKVPVIVTN